MTTRLLRPCLLPEEDAIDDPDDDDETDPTLPGDLWFRTRDSSPCPLGERKVRRILNADSLGER
jgi:hypothetical protein